MHRVCPAGGNKFTCMCNVCRRLSTNDKFRVHGACDRKKDMIRMISSYVAKKTLKPAFSTNIKNAKLKSYKKVTKVIT